MSKKSRRARTKFQGNAGKQDHLQVRAQTTKERAVVPVSARSISLEIKPRNYEHLLPDLRNIVIITGLLFVLLAILTIFYQ